MAKIRHLGSLLANICFLKASLAEDVCPALTRHGKSTNAIFDQRNNETGLQKNLLGLFPIHNKDCTSLSTSNNYNGIQRAMAMIHGLNIVNDQVERGEKTIALNGFVYDTCSNEISAIDSFIEGMGNHDPVSGVIGASYSSVTIPLSMVAHAYNLTMLSYAATSGYLSDKRRHSTFARLLPSDCNQAKVVYDIIKNLTTVRFNNLTEDESTEKKSIAVQVLMNKESEYSQSLNEEFQRLVKDDPDKLILICKVSEFFFINSTEAIEHDQQEIKSLVQSGVDVVVSFLSVGSKRFFLDGLQMALKDQSTKVKSFLLVSTDSWDVGDVSNMEMIQFLSGKSLVTMPYPGDPYAIRYGGNFTDYLGSLNRWKYPWLSEMWQDMCRGNETCLASSLDLETFWIDSKVSFVIDTVMAFSDALERCHKDGCNVRTHDFFEDYILKTSFVEGDDKIQFDCQGNMLRKYGVYILSENGKYKRIGMWSDLTSPRLHFDSYVYSSQINPSMNWTCRPKCSIDQYEEEVKHISSSCCHMCVTIPNHYVKVTSRSIAPCPNGTWPNPQKTKCTSLKQETLAFSSGWTLMALLVAILGLVIVVSVMVVVSKHFNHVMIKSSSRELSVFVWIGVLISHFHTFLVFLVKPTKLTCGLLRFSSTIGYTFILSALLLKVRRIFQIFLGQFRQSNTNLGQPKYISPEHQVIDPVPPILFHPSLSFIPFVPDCLCYWFGDHPVVSSLYLAHGGTCQLDPFVS
ncbi:metabotropic glutamate receptor 2-like [Tigriopus californicus]|uniref:metabotropic glutamate receptor 2-like n=1 Tax=Tigriopus californicus TaxID=6832 RepID=UPI0027DA6E2A|nr:metabotropic glutamate receptor 2-like [Tigriopus californicus]